MPPSAHAYLADARHHDDFPPAARAGVRKGVGTMDDATGAPAPAPVATTFPPASRPTPVPAAPATPTPQHPRPEAVCPADAARADAAGGILDFPLGGQPCPEGDTLPARRGSGRPTLLESLGLQEHDVLAIRRHCLTATRWTDCVSLSLGVRLYASTLDAAHPLRVWAEARASKHHLPESLIDALGFARVRGGRGGRLVAHDQAPGRERLRYEAYAPGTLRLRLDGTRMEAGECESWDDASVNFLLWTELDGQVRVGRFQLLLGVDHATDYVTGFAFVARDRDSYRAEDCVARAMLPTWRAQGVPQRVVLERGVWEASRMGDFLQALQVERTTSYHPRTKLVESVFGRLWTRLGDVTGSVGRSRGEHEHGTRLLREMRAGRLDPRQHCLSMQEATARLAEAIRAHHAEPIESRQYGRWVPAEAYAAQAPRHLRPLQEADAWAARPERRALRVRRSGMVLCSVVDGWDCRHELAFGSADLWRHAGTDVLVYFDPETAADDGATIVSLDGRTVLERRAPLLTGNSLAGVELRRAQARSVRSEHRTLRPDGTIGSWQSERSEAASAATVAMLRTAAGAAPEAGPDEAGTVPARRAQAPVRAETHEPDLAAVEAAEARARQAGLVPAY